MIDDFEVPGTAYGFDDYGPGLVLNLEYLEPLRHLNFVTFFPAAGPDHDTGARRGCVVLSRQGSDIAASLKNVKGLAS